MTIRPGDGRSDAPSTATDRGRRSGTRSIARDAAGRDGSAPIGLPPLGALAGGSSRTRAPWRRDWEHGLEVLHPMGGRVASEVERPLLRPIAAPEPLVRYLGESPQHIGVNTPMPLDDLARSPVSPALVDDAVERWDVE